MTSPSFGDDIDLHGVVNGVDLSDLSQKSIRTNQNETVRFFSVSESVTVILVFGHTTAPCLFFFIYFFINFIKVYR